MITTQYRIKPRATHTNNLKIKIPSHKSNPKNLINILIIEKVFQLFSFKSSTFFFFLIPFILKRNIRKITREINVKYKKKKIINTIPRLKKKKNATK